MTDTKTIALEARDICFTYPEGTKALDAISMRIMEGEFVALLASNGSGKTTLIKSFASLLRPQKGTISIFGKDITDYSQKELFSTMGLVFQNPKDQLFAATVGEDVAFGPRNLGIAEVEVRELVEEALEAVGASHLKNKAIHHLSYGQQKRVSIAGVLAMKPKILILDEPTAGLDPAGESQMLDLLMKLNFEKTVTVIMATHSIDLLPLFAQKIYVLEDGRIIIEGSPERIFSERKPIELAGLRMPYIADLIYQMKHGDGVPFKGLPLTIGEARTNLLDMIQNGNGLNNVLEPKT